MFRDELMKNHEPSLLCDTISAPCRVLEASIFSEVDEDCSSCVMHRTQEECQRGCAQSSRALWARMYFRAMDFLIL